MMLLDAESARAGRLVFKKAPHRTTCSAYLYYPPTVSPMGLTRCNWHRGRIELYKRGVGIRLITQYLLDIDRYAKYSFIVGWPNAIAMVSRAFSISSR